jgi:hypothetical protein
MAIRAKTIARVFESVGGYYICADSLDYLDARGKAYPTKSAALRAAYRCGFTHAIGSGAIKQGKAITSQVRLDAQDRKEHTYSRQYIA